MPASGPLDLRNVRRWNDSWRNRTRFSRAKSSPTKTNTTPISRGIHRSTARAGTRRKGDELPRAVRRGQAVHLRQNPLLQVLVLHVLGQCVEAVRVLDCVAADDLADAALRLSGPVLAGERGRCPGRGRRDLALALSRACPPDPLP